MTNEEYAELLRRARKVNDQVDSSINRLQIAQLVNNARRNGRIEADHLA